MWKARGHRGERIDDAAGILVPQHTEHDGDLVEGEVGREGGGERGDSVRVVRGIHDDRRVGAHELQSSGGRHRGEPLGEHIAHEHLATPAEEGFDGRDRECGVVALVVAVQRQEDVVVGARESANADELPAATAELVRAMPSPSTASVDRSGRQLVRVQRVHRSPARRRRGPADQGRAAGLRSKPDQPPRAP